MEPASPARPTSPSPPGPADPAAPEASAQSGKETPGLDTSARDATAAESPEGAPSGAVPAADATRHRSPAIAGEEPATGGADAEQAGASPRLQRGQERSPRDMIMSLAVLLVPIALLLIFYRVMLNGDAPITVDPSPAIEEAQRAAAFTVVVPRGLGDDWHVSSATFSRQGTGATLRLGYVDPDDDPVLLVQSSVPAATLLPTELGASAKPLGNFRSPAGVWRVYDARPGEKAIVLAEPTRTVVVVGNTDLENLETLATSLR